MEKVWALIILTSGDTLVCEDCNRSGIDGDNMYLAVEGEEDDQMVVVVLCKECFEKEVE